MNEFITSHRSNEGIPCCDSYSTWAVFETGQDMEVNLSVLSYWKGVVLPNKMFPSDFSELV